MHLSSIRIRNYRRLKNVRVDLDSLISIFVGANNSGKTSATQAIQMFVGGAKEKFSIHDFSAECWQAFNHAGGLFPIPDPAPALPTISLDIWFTVTEADLHRVIDLLPSLSWEGTMLGVRVEFGPKSVDDLLNRYHEDSHKAQEAAGGGYRPWPKNLTDYLSRRLHAEYELRHYVLDRARFEDKLEEMPGYTPRLLASEPGRGGAKVLKSLIRVDCLNAQRHQSDDASGGRSEDLSKCLSRFYTKHLEKRADDHAALGALAESEAKFNEHLEAVFESTLGRLRQLGYPSNPRLQIKADLKPETLLKQEARVHYVLGDAKEGEPATLPDRYNGLGYKNLVYMVVELLSLHNQWLDEEEDVPPLHLVLVEEPEAHLHAQLQQVFIREVLDLLKVEAPDNAACASQLVVTTHSPHILYERGFRPIRYFRRMGNFSEVLNLSAFYDAEKEERDFLERYMKLTHCDLFFADAAILVEGNVERLLLPLMIEKAQHDLRSVCLSILEVGGAFAHRFKTLLEFLGITALVITDIDSVVASPPPAEGEEDEDAVEEEVDETDGDAAPVRRIKACMVGAEGAETSNQTLIKWLPAKRTVAELLGCASAERTQEPDGKSLASVMVTYQTKRPVRWGTEEADLAGRTLEEAFALENLDWCQTPARKHLGLHVAGKGDTQPLETMAAKLHKRVKGSGFDKTKFALGVLAEGPEGWSVPHYIADGLAWLAGRMNPPAPAEVPAEGDEG
ncbi:MAG: AAA family ATPase [Phaeospirillum sp.]|nr:AAA family ATPase [Phaeospirillum sp.]